MPARARVPAGSRAKSARKRSRIWIPAALLVALGTWLVLGKPFDAPVPRAAGTESESFAEEQQTSETPAPTELQSDLVPDAGPEPAVPSEPPLAIPQTAEQGIRLYGSLLDERTGESIGRSCSVRIVDEEWEERELRTEGAAAYEFEELHPGSWEITVEAALFQTLRTRVHLEPGEKEKKVDLLLRPALAVKVRVVASGGPGFRVTPAVDRLRVDGLRRDIDWGFPTSIGLDVVATITEPGRWIAGDPKLDSTAGAFIAADREHVQDQAWRKTGTSGLTLQQRQLRELGYTDPSGEEVERSQGPDPRWQPVGRSLIDLPPEYCGVLTLTETPPIFASLAVNGCVLQTVSIPLGADEISFSLASADLEKLPGAVRFVVVDEETNARPLDFEASLDEARSMRDERRAVERDGTVLFRNVLPGPATLLITALGREVVKERILVQPGGITDLGTYRLQRCSRFDAKVVDDEGKPASLIFNVFPLDRYEVTRETLAKRCFRSTREGNLKVDSIGKGRYLVVAAEEGWTSIPVLADTTFRRKEPIEIRVSRGTSVALKLRADPPAHGRLSIRTGSALPVAEFHCRDQRPMRCLLAPGRYIAELHDGETWLWSESFVVGTEPVRRYLPR